MNFEELNKMELSADERSALQRLFKTSDWKVFSNVVEKHILKKTGALVRGNFNVQEGFDEIKYLTGLRGFVENWNKLIVYMGTETSDEYEKKNTSD